MLTRYLLTMCLFAVCLTATLKAQTGISIQSRHVLNPPDEIRLREYVFDHSFLSNQGAAIELFRSRDKKLYAVALGFKYRKGLSPSISDVPEFFAQVKFRFFSSLFKKPAVESYFSLGPRILYTEGTIFTSNTNVFQKEMWLLGVEVPIIFNLDFKLPGQFRLFTNFNVLSTFISVDTMKVLDPSIHPNLQTNSSFNLDLLLFNEFRIGLGYILKGKESYRNLKANIVGASFMGVLSLQSLCSRYI